MVVPSRPVICDASRAVWRRGIAAGCALGAMLACAGQPAQARQDAVVWEGEDQSVAVAPQDEETAPPNDHPVTIAPDDIERMLSGLRFRRIDQEADAEPLPVFNEEQIEILGKALSTGLSQATASQDVIFSIIGAHRMSPGAFVRRNRLTAGRAFLQEGELNVIFGEIQSPYRKKNVYGRLEKDFSPREFGSRASPDADEAVLLASTDVSLRDDPQGRRDDWVIFGGAVPAAAPIAPAASADEPADDAPAGMPSPVASPSNAGTAGRSGAQEDSASGDIEGRLATLKDLREKDLISEDVYREKVDEILNDL